MMYGVSLIFKHISDLRSKLESVSKAHYSSGEGCLEGTRVKLLSNVNEWARGTGENVDKKTVWVHGHAGSGKSALLHSIAESFENADIPFICFPCKRDDPELSNIHRILTTISYRLTEYCGNYRSAIADLADHQSKGLSVLTGDMKKQSELLFGKRYELISLGRANRHKFLVILIDALDECRNHRDGGKTSHERCALLEFLLNFANFVPWIKVIITSRPELDIREVFTDATSAVHRIDINEEKWNSSADIRVFVEAQSAKLKLRLSPEQIDRFQAKACGLFIWCTTVFRYIAESKESRTDLVANILEGHPLNSNDNPHAPLYLLYQRVLDSAVSRASDREMMESVFSVIFVAATRRPLSTNAIADILYPREEGEGRRRKREWVENITKSFLSIVYIEEGTKAVRACHLSVLDFIGGMMNEGFPKPMTNPGDNAAPRFTVGVKEVHMRMFEGCFSIMNRNLRFNICELEDSFRLNKDVPDLPARISEHLTESLQYAVVFWASHLADSDVDAKRNAEKVHEFLASRKTLFWVEALSVMDVVDRGIVILQDCAHFFAVRSYPRNLVQ